MPIILITGYVVVKQWCVIFVKVHYSHIYVVAFAYGICNIFTGNLKFDSPSQPPPS